MVPSRTGRLIAVALAGCAALSGCAAVVDGNATKDPAAAATPAAADSQVVAPERMPALLLDAPVIASIMGAPTMAVTDHREETMGDSDLRISNPRCMGAQYAGEESVYQGSGYLSFRLQRVAEPGDHFDHVVEQAVTNFMGADAAQAFVKNVTDTWTGCAGSSLAVHFNQDNHDATWTIGQPVSTDTSIAVLNYQEDGDGWACQHDLAAQANVVVEALACAKGVTNQGVTVANRILARVPE